MVNFVFVELWFVDGCVMIVVYFLGEEFFVDKNGNNVYDSGEDF